MSKLPDKLPLYEISPGVVENNSVEETINTIIDYLEEKQWQFDEVVNSKADTVKRIGDFPKNDIEKHVFTTSNVYSLMTEDRLATADVLCAVLEGEKLNKEEEQCNCDLEPSCGCWWRNHNQALNLAQDIIRKALQAK